MEKIILIIIIVIILCITAFYLFQKAGNNSISRYYYNFLIKILEDNNAITYFEHLINDDEAIKNKIKSPLLNLSPKEISYLYEINDDIEINRGISIAFVNIIKPLLLNHKKILIRNYKTKIYKDPYEEYRFEEWNKEIDYFYTNFIILELDRWLEKNIYPSSYRFYNTAILNIDSHISEKIKNLIFMEISELALETDLNNTPLNYSSDFTGFEYEEFVAELFINAGYDVNLTSKSGDEGTDLLVDINGIKLAVQCKHLNSGKVSNKAVQEVYTAKDMYDCDYAAVISNADFTRAAHETASKLSVALLHHDGIDELIELYE